MAFGIHRNHDYEQPGRGRIAPIFDAADILKSLNGAQHDKVR
jgi:hypothetical protein